MASSSGCARRAGGPSSPVAAGRGANASRRKDGERPAGPDQRFPRSRRLTSRRQFLAIYAEGSRAPGPSFTVFGCPNASTTSRLGVTATRKYGNAVQRNRAKRLLREIFRRNRARLEPACDMVINVHPAFRKATKDELERLFLSCFARIARRYR